VDPFGLGGILVVVEEGYITKATKKLSKYGTEKDQPRFNGWIRTILSSLSKIRAVADAKDEVRFVTILPDDQGEFFELIKQYDTVIIVSGGSPGFLTSTPDADSTGTDKDTTDDVLTSEEINGAIADKNRLFAGTARDKQNLIVLGNQQIAKGTGVVDQVTGIDNSAGLNYTSTIGGDGARTAGPALAYVLTYLQMFTGLSEDFSKCHSAGDKAYAKDPGSQVSGAPARTTKSRKVKPAKGPGGG